METSDKPFVLDLASLDTVKACNEGAEIELTHPVTKRPLGMFISIVGKDSDAFQEYVAQSSDDDKRRGFEAQRKNKTPQPKYFAQQKADAIALLVACTTGFRNVNFNGPLDFNEANATKLYTSLPWVREQVDAAIVDYENFIKS